MNLNELSDRANASRARTRVGRGIGSGKGKRSGRGDKGQRSRSGVALKGFEGGQMPIHRRLPKRGFNNIFRKRFAAVNVGRLQAAVDAGKIDASKPVDAAAMDAAGIVTRLRDGVRLLGKGKLTTKLSVEVDWASAGAKTAVEKVGGRVTVLRQAKSEAVAKKGRKPEEAKASAPEAQDDGTSAGEEARTRDDKPERGSETE